MGIQYSTRNLNLEDGGRSDIELSTLYEVISHVLPSHSAAVSKVWTQFNLDTDTSNQRARRAISEENQRSAAGGTSGLRTPDLDNLDSALRTHKQRRQREECVYLRCVVKDRSLQKCEWRLVSQASLVWHQHFCVQQVLIDGCHNLNSSSILHLKV